MNAVSCLPEDMMMRKRLHDERGATGILILLVIFIVLFMTPFFLDFASVYYARSTTQTGSDAASLAAAKDYARRLSRTWHGGCGEPEASVVGRYLVYVQGTAWNSEVGYNSARQYASENQNELTGYSSRTSSRHTTVAGVPIPYVDVFVSTKKPVHLLYRRFYRRSFETPAKATAEAYMDHHDHWTDLCIIGETVLVRHHYRFYWKIRLIK